jgi:hypothetical protein
MTTIYVTFTNAQETVIQDVFAIDQSAGAYQHYGSVDISDARYATWYGTQPSWVQSGRIEPVTASS